MASGVGALFIQHPAGQNLVTVIDQLDAEMIPYISPGQPYYSVRYIGRFLTVDGGYLDLYRSKPRHQWIVFIDASIFDGLMPNG